MHSEETTLVQQEIFRAPDAAAYLKISESQLSKLRMKVNRDSFELGRRDGCEILRAD